MKFMAPHHRAAILAAFFTTVESRIEPAGAALADHLVTRLVLVFVALSYSMIRRSKFRRRAV
ncbi:hypothetical protein [Pseudomonas sp. RGM2987]|uniref:hypothetical protein n=1 Tax=Pseudomonas sp. RGM2987 TaxID=2930090 RepID=UPI001FD64E19|nr:hypothetical protein [Pseudomonas sp. RGM2987]MCJ8204824.1 hypothetical protein [Pseudomonas sp. RGM2987]